METNPSKLAASPQKVILMWSLELYSAPDYKFHLSIYLLVAPGVVPCMKGKQAQERNPGNMAREKPGYVFSWGVVDSCSHPTDISPASEFDAVGTSQNPS